MQASAPVAGDSLTVLVLATVALRRGDMAAAAEYGQRLSAIGRYYGSPYLADGICLVAAQVLEARRGPRAALDFLAEALAGLPEHRSVLLADPASAPWLVRAALAAGDRALAARIVSAINDTARDNPTLAVIRASAEHAEGLLAGDVSRLQHAADQLFISTHTVAFHLRQMFRKLDISSRVDLARIALAHARPGDGETP